VSSPKHNEICIVIDKLKSDKVAGADNIAPEMTKKWRKNFET
jgi:hypothetical protein